MFILFLHHDVTGRSVVRAKDADNTLKSAKNDAIQIVSTHKGYFHAA
jgi:hypothetical protein